MEPGDAQPGISSGDTQEAAVMAAPQAAASSASASVPYLVAAPATSAAEDTSTAYAARGRVRAYLHFNAAARNKLLDAKRTRDLAYNECIRLVKSDLDDICAGRKTLEDSAVLSLRDDDLGTKLEEEIQALPDDERRLPEQPDPHFLQQGVLEFVRAINFLRLRRAQYDKEQTAKHTTGHEPFSHTFRTRDVDSKRGELCVPAEMYNAEDGPYSFLHGIHGAFDDAKQEAREPPQETALESRAEAEPEQEKDGTKKKKGKKGTILRERRRARKLGRQLAYEARRQARREAEERGETIPKRVVVLPDPAVKTRQKICQMEKTGSIIRPLTDGDGNLVTRKIPPRYIERELQITFDYSYSNPQTIYNLPRYVKLHAT